MLLKILLILLFTVPAYAADFNKVFKDVILPHEGGYTSIPNDPGNWTGGKVGKGKLLGTKYGIAANTYGNELLKQGKTIKGLTESDANAIYKRDFWDRYNASLSSSQHIADELCLITINVGPGHAHDMIKHTFDFIEWLERHKDKNYHVPVKIDFSPAMWQFINNYTDSLSMKVLIWYTERNYAQIFYIKLVDRKPSMRPFLESWIRRTVN